MLHAWVVYPVVFLLVAYGLGLLVEAASGCPLPGTLALPMGFAALVVLAGIGTATAATAPLTAPAIAVIALVGLLARGRTHRLARAPALAALGAALAYGAPVILSGKATFAGYLKLDDTATWLAFTDQVMTHGRSLTALPPSTYQLLLHDDVGTGYPLGAFMALGVGGKLAGLDPAWAFAPHLAICGAMVALCGYTLLTPIVVSARWRAVAAFVGAQPALLYGYAQWGGIKEITLAFVVLLIVTVAATMLPRRTGRPRELVPLAVVSASMTVVIGPGAVVFVAPVLLVVAAVWLRPRAGRRAALIRSAWLAGLTVLLALPTWIALTGRLDYGTQFATSTQSQATLLGNLLHPLSAFQLGGIWLERDFRTTAATLPTAPLLVLVGLAAAGALWWTARRRQPGLWLYVALVLIGCLAGAVTHASPWLLGKTLAIASPAVPLAAMTGAVLWAARSRLGVVLVAVLLGGVLWSNALAYTDTTLAPRDRLAELEHIGKLVDGKGPTFDDEYEVYGDRHFLRRGAPVQPAEYRTQQLPLIGGQLLTKSAYADIDAFPLSTLQPYRSIVVSSSPTASRPPSSYALVWQGRYVSLYQRPATPAPTVLRHVPLGDSTQLPFCGNAQNAAPRGLCPELPVAVPSCSEITALGRDAAAAGAQLMAYERPGPIVLRGDDTRWPAAWLHDPVGHSITATVPGTAVARIAVATKGEYALWLGGSFARGFTLTLDGHDLGRVADQLAAVGGAVPVADVSLTAGTHTLRLTYPHAGLRAGAADPQHLTSLGTIVLQQQQPAPQMLTVPPAAAAALCGRALDWVEIVR